MQKFRGFRLGRSRALIAVVAVVGLGGGVEGCDLLGTDINASLPPCVDSYCDCRDFISQAAAQEVLNAFKADPHGLDQRSKWSSLRKSAAGGSCLRSGDLFFSQ